MFGGVVAVLAVPDRSQYNYRCSHYLSEIQTLPHVLGFCLHGVALRNMQHQTIRSVLAKSVREIVFTVYEGILGLAAQESTQHIDITAIKNIQAYQ